MKRDEAIRYARLHKLMYAEVSARTDEGVQEAFSDLFEKIYSKPKLWLEDGLTDAGAVRLAAKPLPGMTQKKSDCACN